MSSIDGKKIAVVGGVTLARLLQQKGAQISVYERDPRRSARVQGSAFFTKILDWRRWELPA